MAASDPDDAKNLRSRDFCINQVRVSKRELHIAHVNPSL